jgi:ribosomal protein S16
MANIKYRSLKIKFIRMGRKGRWFYYLWLFKNKKKFKLIGRYFPHQFKINDQFIKVSIIETTLLNHYIRQGAVCEGKIARLFQGLL